MKLVEYEIRNFLSFSHEFIHPEPGLILVTGQDNDTGSSNGAGKSTLVNKALMWILFGKTSEGVGSDDIINNNTKDTQGRGWGWASIDIGGIQYNISRTRIKGESPLLEFSSSQHQSLTKSKIVETQKTINETIGLDLDLFKYTSLFGQGVETPFMQLSPSRKSSILEKILPFDVIDSWAEDADTKRKEYLEEYETLKNQIIRAETNYETLSHNLTQSLNNKNSWDYAQDARLETLKSNLEEVCKRIESLLHHEKEFPNIVANRSKLLEAKNHYKNPNCPTCGQFWDKSKGLSLEEVEKRLKWVNAQYNNANHWISILHRDKETRRSLEDQIEFLSNDKNPYEADYKRLKFNVDSLKLLLESHNNRRKELEERLELTSFWHDVFSSKFRLALYDNVCPFLEFKINKHLQSMNNNHISAVVSTSRELKSGKNKGEFNIEVSSTTGANSYIHLSGGERQIVDFAVGLSIAELANSQTKTSTNILVLDEPFVDLDKRNSESVVEYLKTLIDEGYKDTIFLVSNDDNIKGLIPNKIVLEKTNGISKVVQAS